MTSIVETDLTWWDALARIGADRRPFVVASGHTGHATEVVLAAIAENRYDAVRFALAPGADLSSRIERAVVTEGASWALVTELIDLQLLLEGEVRMHPSDPPSTTRSEPPVAIEEALLIADAIRDGDPARLDAALEVLGWTRVPDWLRDFGFGASGQLTVSVLRPGQSGRAAIGVGRQLGAVGLPTGSIDVLHAIALSGGWGLLTGDRDGGLHFDGIGAMDLQAELNAICSGLSRREAA